MGNNETIDPSATTAVPNAKDLPTDIYWLDLETTGLDPRKPGAMILELALYRAPFTDPFNVTKVFDAPIAHSAFDIQRAKQDSHATVYEMHTLNGLWDECVAAHRRGQLQTAGIERVLRTALPEIEHEKHPPVLAGSSVHFDHDWLSVHMPSVARLFSHRHLDVRSIVLDCCSRGMPYIHAEPAHRAFADIQQSMAQLQACRAWDRSAVGGA